jgi:sucrose-6-phosphate hydrolase SacC (GH32 family)
MFKWKKLGKVFDPTEFSGPAWMKEFAKAPSTLIFDDFVRVYFSCHPKRDSQGNHVSHSTFIDLDKTDLFNIINVAKKPVIDLGKKGCFDEHGTYPISVITVGNEIWAYYAGWSLSDSVPFNTAIGFAKSNDDGLFYKKEGKGPVLSYSLDEPYLISGPKIRKFADKFYLFYIAGRKWLKINNKFEMSLKIKLAISKNGIDWKKQNKNLIKDEIGINESQASPDVFYHDNKYHMFFDYWDPYTFRKTGSRKIGYAFSHDLINWTRQDSLAGIDTSESGWDSKMIAYPHVFKYNKNIFMIYIGNEVGKCGFGLAQLESD